jgi:YHS domain-containing protein
MKELALLVLPLLVTVVVMSAYRRSTGPNVRSEINLMSQKEHSETTTTATTASTTATATSTTSTSNGAASSSSMMTGTKSQQTTTGQGQQQEVHAGADSGDDSCSCPDAMAENPCSVAGEAVLGGLDFVQYFTTFQLADGSYNESNIGEIGSADYSSTYDGFNYLFLSQENKDLFDASPTSYIPQWGGFCSWGIGYESCPPYPWAADCLGPSGNWGHWTIQSGKLYFFLFEAAKEKFMEDPDTYIASGDVRWSSWFSDAYGHMSTHCFATDPTATSTH